MSIFIGHKPNRQHIQALRRCKQPENDSLLDLFRTVLEDTKTSLIAAEDPVRIHRLQGRAEVLSEFLDSVSKSDEIMERVDKRPA
jgi:hypothetical protein